MKIRILKRDENILGDLKEAREEVFIGIYRKYRDSFISWTAKFYSCDQDTASDCFQDAVIILMNNAKSGKLVQLDSGLKTYLFSVGKNVLLKKYSMKKIEMSLGEIPAEYESVGLNEYDELFNYKNKLIDKIAELAISMKEPCKSILKYYYYENLSMDKIAEVMKYKNADTVKSQKLRCMKYLEDSLENEML
ncbi:MAG: sigma-70 family RNA polymerase sigma factor [Bacteroidia bacterium]|nr:MAG: sigma-70 family RNA polymerase sigma factor [Bacteroidia bacterium]